MPIINDNIPSEIKYIVKYDADKNGVADDIAFSDEPSAIMFEDCFVNDGKDERCEGWRNKLGADPKLPSLAYLQLYTNTKHKACRDSGDYIIDLLTRNEDDQSLTINNASVDCLPRKDDREYFSSNRKILERNTTVSGINCAAGSLLYVSSDGKIERCELANDQKVQGIKLTKGTVLTFDYADKLKTAIPRDNSMIAGVPCLKDEEVSFHDNGQIEKAYLSKPLKTGGITYAAGTQINFEKNGIVETGYTHGNQTIRGIFIPSGSFVDYAYGDYPSHVTLSKDTFVDGQTLIPKGKTINFYPANYSDQYYIDVSEYSYNLSGAFSTESFTNDKLSFSSTGYATIVLGDNKTFQNIELHGGDTVVINDHNRIESIYPKNDITVNGMTIGNGGEVSFYDSGKVHELKLTYETEIQGLSFGSGDDIVLTENGELLRVSPAREMQIQGLRFQAKDYIAFHKGTIRTVSPNSPFTIHGIEFGNDDWISLNEDSSLASVRLGENRTIQGIDLEKSDQIIFGENNKIKNITFASDRIFQEEIFMKKDSVDLDENGKIATNKE